MNEISPISSVIDQFDPIEKSSYYYLMCSQKFIHELLFEMLPFVFCRIQKLARKNIAIWEKKDPVYYPHMYWRSLTRASWRQRQHWVSVTLVFDPPTHGCSRHRVCRVARFLVSMTVCVWTWVLVLVNICIRIGNNDVGARVSTVRGVDAVKEMQNATVVQSLLNTNSFSVSFILQLVNLCLIYS